MDEDSRRNDTSLLAAQGASENNQTVPQGTPFSLEALSDCFKRALMPNGTDVDIAVYLDAFKEIVKLLDLLGVVFYFVVTDVRNKIDILEGYLRHGTAKDHYVTVKSMVEYEVDAGLTAAKVSTSPCGCRTLLRLHWALECVLLIFRRIHESDEDSSVPAIFSRSYDESLSKHHIDMMRKCVAVALRMMPSRINLLKRMEPFLTPQRILELLLITATLGQPLYDAVQLELAEKDLLSLP